jgi:hypothetical protein
MKGERDGLDMAVDVRETKREREMAAVVERQAQGRR